MTGLCRFAEDVSADLVDQAIEHFRVIGKLLAPLAVREVLARKRNEPEGIGRI